MRVNPRDDNGSTDSTSATGPPTARIDLHCHSRYSGATDMWMARALRVGEYPAEPHEIYRRAKARGMTHVTITDRDAIEGGLRLAHRDDFILGTEATAFFPSEAHAVHVLVWGLDEEQHRQIQALRYNIHELVAYLTAEGLCHGLAHPASLRTSGLRPDQFEQLLLLFGFWEVRDGAAQRVVNDLAIRLARVPESTLARLSAKHGFAPVHTGIRWFGGSNDLSSLDAGATYTEVELGGDGDVLAALRSGVTRPKGEMGSTAKTARMVIGLAASSGAGGGGRVAGWFLDNVLGSEPQTWLLRYPAGQKLLGRALGMTSWGMRAGGGGMQWKRTALAEIGDALLKGGLGQGAQRYQRLEAIIDETWRQATVDRIASLRSSIERHSGKVADDVRDLVGVQILLAPYLMAAAYCAGERRHAARLSGALEDSGVIRSSRPRGEPRVAMFTDTFADVNGVATVLRALQREAQAVDFPLHLVSCGDTRTSEPGREQFQALERMRLDVYSDFPLDLPPLLEILSWCEHEDIDVIHAATPGPMGLAANILARVLDVPLIGTYHTDVPRLGYFLTGDHLLEEILWGYMRWFYRSCVAVLSPSRGVERDLTARGLRVRFEPLDQAVDPKTFSPGLRDPELHERLGGGGSVILWVGRISAEKNLDLLAAAYARLCQKRSDARLVVVGEGPYREAFEKLCPEATLLGLCTGQELARIYASSDVFVFPGTAETFGQVVLEAAMSGLPAIVTAGTVPSEAVEPGVSALAVSPGDADGIVSAIETLLDDHELWARMSAAARVHAASRTWRKTFASLREVYRDVRW